MEEEQLEVQEVDAGPEETLSSVRSEIARLRDYEQVLIQAIDAKRAEEEAKKPKVSFIEQCRANARVALEQKLAKVARGQNPMSEIDKFYKARSRRPRQ